MNTHPTIIHPQVNLTVKQRRFCEEYCVDYNATRAAKVAGYSERTAQRIGSENLSKLVIADFIQEIQKDLSKLAGVSALSNIEVLKQIRDDNQEKTVHRIRSIEVINKMLGLNAPEKQDFTTDGKSIDLINWVNNEQPLFPDIEPKITIHNNGENVDLAE
ncbi:MAG: terminase small subunit [Bacteroidetes bacterium]|nr:terminase small subunit [Bacteroidota bacterium]